MSLPYFSANLGLMDENALKSAFREAPKPSRRIARADRTRAHALSPIRILLRVVFLPVAVLGITASVYIRTSPFSQEDALRHLIAMAGCQTATQIDVAGARLGEPGYHARHDPDGDGIACAAPLSDRVSSEQSARPVRASTDNGAKFLRP